jgi:type II secretory ATPase GspE/PulE/Tfp pilus assembly ATPase PilB-like protein
MSNEVLTRLRAWESVAGRPPGTNGESAVTAQDAWPWPGDDEPAVHEAVDRLIEHAAAREASDLYFCTNEDHVAILARHLGMLRAVNSVPLEMGRHCIAHVKTMAGLDPTERRRPLDGRWVNHRPGGTILDLRIETVPTLHGEDLALRLLDRRSRLMKLDALGLSDEELYHLRVILRRPGGLILVSGPGGSGKTTTLYSLLAELNDGGRKINTIEDPVECTLPGIRQSQINPRIGLDFPDLLRAVLRQGADVILVGEIRDAVTAQTAVRAANSGHLVLATLHAPSAAGAVQSMLGLDVHPHHLAGALRAAVAQRFVRTLCPLCKVLADPAPTAQLLAGVDAQLPDGCVAAPCRPVGCPACRGNGYNARTGLFEVLTVSEPIRRLIAAGQPSQAIHKAAVADGMKPIDITGLVKAALGQTTVAEIMRVVPAGANEEADAVEL